MLSTIYQKRYPKFNNGVIINVISLFIISRLLFLLFSIIAAKIIPLREGYLGNQLYTHIPDVLWIWANFDGRHFSSITLEGYERTNFAFFPLYPLLMRGLGNFLQISYLYSGIIISLGAFFVSLILVYKIVRLDFSDRVTWWSIILLSLFPLAFFYQALYADSLFLLLTTASFYFARRGNWLLSGVFVFLTTLTRLSGIALLPAFAIEWYLQNRKPIREWKMLLIDFLRNGVLTFIVGISGLLLYMAVLQFYFGDALLFQKAMVAWRQNEFVFPLQVVWRYMKIFWFVQKDFLVFWIALLEFVSLFLYMALAVYVWKKVRVSYGVFMVILLLLVTFTGTFAGTPRYMLHLFPGFIGMAMLVEQYKFLKLPVLLLFAVLGFLFVGLFTRGYFVA